MAVNKDELGKGKDDWMNYQKKLQEIKQNKVDDKAHQEEVAKKAAERAAKKGTKPTKVPGQGFQLG